MIIKKDAPAEFTTACNETVGMVPEIDALYSKGQDIMCSDQCPCAAGKTYLIALLLIDPANFPAAYNATMKTDETGAKVVTDCPSFTMTDEENSQYLPLIKGLEADFGCAGMCSAPKYYLFSDVALGAPATDCRDTLVSQVSDKADLYGGVLLGIGLLGLTAFGLSFGICYLRKDQAKKELYKYKRFQ